MTITSGLFGVRTDLPLAGIWWHRLFTVLFALTSLVIFLGSALLAYRDPDRSQNNIEILHSLGSYTDAHPELADSVPTFRELGKIGQLTDSGIVEDFYLSSTDIMCSTNLEGHPEEVAEFFRQSDPTDKSDSESAKEWLKTTRQSGQLGNCIVPGGRDHIRTSSKIVAYKFSRGSFARSYARAAGIGSLAVLGWSLVLLNLYYRGLIYVVFGGRPREGRPTSR